ncbi:hypothetical protein DRN74_05235 [Candidatus Micrarchaeota archaeon]|nr:MAG: hypothetical protein DRN74_05235 [Candidatus Micrarchaeota archaeon]
MGPNSDSRIKRRWWESPRIIGASFVLGLVGLLVGIAGTSFTVITYFLNKPVYRLDAYTVFSKEYTAERKPLSGGHTLDIIVMFDGQRVEWELKEIVVQLQNSGNRELSSDDFEALYLEFPENVNLLSVDVAEKPSPDMQFNVHLTSGPGRGRAPPVGTGDTLSHPPIRNGETVENRATKRVPLEFRLFKPGETVVLSAYFIGELGEGFPRLGGRGRAILRTLTAPPAEKALSPITIAILALVGLASLWGEMFIIIKLLRFMRMYRRFLLKMREYW